MGPAVRPGQGYRWPTNLRIALGLCAKRDVTSDIDAHRTCYPHRSPGQLSGDC
jgi:hypothetical protein